VTFNINMNIWRRHRRDLTGGVLIAVVLAAGAFVFWYRAAYNVLPGPGAATRVHWCGRDYEWHGGTSAWAQLTARTAGRPQLAGHYPPLGGQAALYAVPVRPLGDSPCAIDVYLKAGPDPVPQLRAGGRSLALLAGGQLGEAAVQEAAFGAVGGEVAGLAVGGAGLDGAAEAAQEFGPARVQVAEAVQPEAVDDAQARVGAAGLGQGDGPALARPGEREFNGSTSIGGAHRAGN
jgi:hypothetical protein